jgi:hypothetical protein
MLKDEPASCKLSTALGKESEKGRFLGKTGRFYPLKKIARRWSSSYNDEQSFKR